MKTINTLIILFALIAVVACSSNSKSKQSVNVVKSPAELALESAKEADSALEYKDYPLAIIKYSEAVDYYEVAKPTSSPLDSIPQKIYLLNKNIANVYLINAQNLAAQDQYNDALIEYESSLNKYNEIRANAPESDKIDEIISTLYKNTAFVSRKVGDSQKALQYYDLYLEANPDSVDILIQKFEIYRDDLKNENQAYEILKEYATTKNDFNASNRLGDLYQEKNDVDNAILWYEKANSIISDANVLKQLGNLYRNPKKQLWEKSNQALDAFMKLNPSRDEIKTAYKLIGDNYNKLKNKAKAVEYFEKYSEMEYDGDIAIFLCSYYFDAKNNTKTLFWANKVLENNPNDVRAVLFRAITKYNLKDLKGAKADFERIKNDQNFGKTAQQYLQIIK